METADPLCINSKHSKKHFMLPPVLIPRAATLKRKWNEFCLAQAALANGSCRSCCLYWTISPLFNYVFVALLFSPQEIGNT